MPMASSMPSRLLADFGVLVQLGEEFVVDLLQQLEVQVVQLEYYFKDVRRVAYNLLASLLHHFILQFQNFAQQFLLVVEQLINSSF